MKSLRVDAAPVEVEVVICEERPLVVVVSRAVCLPSHCRAEMIGAAVQSGDVQRPCVFPLSV